MKYYLDPKPEASFRSLGDSLQQVEGLALIRLLYSGATDLNLETVPSSRGDLPLFTFYAGDTVLKTLQRDLIISQYFDIGVL